MSADKRAILRRVRVFADLGDEDCDAVLAVLKAKRGAPGDVLFREGERGESLMIVLEGQLVASVRGVAGEDSVIATLGPGEVVGEMAFIDAEPRSATVSTPNGALVVDLGHVALAELRRRAPRALAGILRNVLADVARRLRDAGEKITDGAAPREVRGSGSMRRVGHATVEQLRALAALAGYSTEDLDLLSHIASVRQFSRGETLMVEGAEGDVCFLVVAGDVAVSRRAMPIATLGPGAMVGQLALLDRAPRSATVTSTLETTALEVSASAFSNLLRACSPIALRFQYQIALAGVRQLREATRRLSEAQNPVALEGPRSGHELGSSIDDWDDGVEPPSIELELAVDPHANRR